MKLDAQFQRPLPARLEIGEVATGVVITVALHLLVIAFITHTGEAIEQSQPEPVELLPVIATDLLRWGEQMPDERELPVIANPAPAREREPEPSPPAAEQEPAPPETEVVDLNVASAEPAPRRETELRSRVEDRAPDAPQTPYRGEHNPNRPINDAPIAGSPDGFLGGTSLDEAAMRNHLSRIQQQLQRAFQPPQSISEAQLRRLRVRMRIQVTPQGQITAWEVDRSSGNRIFDMYAERALDQFKTGTQRLDLSSIRDEGLRARLIRDGFVVDMQGR